MFANGSRNIPCLHKVDNISNIFSNVMKKNKSEQVLQISSHVVAEVYANKCSTHGRRQFVISNATL
jgi:hypothetical protein